MKKLLISFVAFVAISLGARIVTAAPVALAAGPPPIVAAVDPDFDVCHSSTMAPSAHYCGTPSSQDPLTGPTGTLLKAARIITIITAAASVIMIIIAGIRYIVASGDPQSITSSRDQIIYALVGLVISGMAQGIIAFVINRVQVR